MLPSDDGVRQAELEEERLEDSEVFTRSQAKTLRGQTERLRLPGGDGVGDGEGHILRSRFPGPIHNKQADFTTDNYSQCNLLLCFG